MMDVNSVAFWVIAAIWFTVPILSWCWSLVSIHYYRKIIDVMKEANTTLERTKKLNEEMLAYRLETMELRTKAEEEIKMACKYYTQVADLVGGVQPALHFPKTNA